MSPYKSNKQKAKPTYTNAKRTDINTKQADAQKRTPGGVPEKQHARCPVKSSTDHLVHSSCIQKVKSYTKPRFKSSSKLYSYTRLKNVLCIVRSSYAKRKVYFNIN